MEIEVVAEDLVVDDDRTATWAAEPGGAAARRAAKRPASPPRAAPPPKLPRAGSERAPVAVGQRVEGKWLAQKSSAQTRWFLGRAAAVHPDGCVDINYDDGDFEGRVPPRFVRVVDEATVDRAAAAAACTIGGMATW